ncbi:MAG: hypothetical protein IJ134_04905 [Bacilli bacterium]|nr:hypothetical protein [Bacilli bacterium]
MFGNKKKKKVVEYLKISNDYKYKNEALAYFSSKKLYKEFDDELLIKIVTIIIDENIPFLSSINIAENLYDVIVFNNSNEEISLFLKCLKLIYDSSIKEYYMFNILFNIFENKQLFINLISNVNNYNLSDLVSDKFYNYLITTRKYFIDEFAFYSKALEVLKKVRNCDSLNVDFIIEEEIKIDKMISGVYDDLPTIDDVDNLEKKVKNSSEILSNRIEEITELVNTNLVSIETKISENKKYNVN